MTICYTVNDALYINLTNRCSNSCDFCIRNNGDGVYGSDSLWLEREPTVDEVLAAIDGYDISRFKELVFCGYGEPTERAADLVRIAKTVKERYGIRIRVNTNGQGNLINGKDITGDLAGTVDVISVSLNASTAEEYDAVCHSVYGLSAYNSVIEFARLCVSHGITTVLSVVDITVSAEAIKRCEDIARSVGAVLRIRAFES